MENGPPEQPGPRTVMSAPPGTGRTVQSGHPTDGDGGNTWRRPQREGWSSPHERKRAPRINYLRH